MSIKKTGVDQQLIRDLADILNDTDLTEIEVEHGDLQGARRAPDARRVQAYAAAPAQAPAARCRRDAGRRACSTPRPTRRAMPSPRPWSAPPTCSPAPDAKAFVEVGADGARRARRCSSSKP